MDTEPFIRVGRIEQGRGRHFVVNGSEPGFSVEVMPSGDGDQGRPTI